MTAPIVVGRPLQVVRPEEAAALRADRPRLAAPGGLGEPAEQPPTWRTLADISDDPPRDLLLGMLDPARAKAPRAPGSPLNWLGSDGGSRSTTLNGGPGSGHGGSRVWVVTAAS
jgi:hypothetical protein